MHAVFSWELGAGYGHVQPMLALGQRLRESGVRISCLLPDQRFETLLRESLDASVWVLPQPPAPDAGQRPVSWPDLLCVHGYGDGDALTKRVQAVRRMLARLAPDLLLMEHAPVTLLASRGMAVTRILHGTGFTLPPARDPMPTFRQDDGDRAARAEQTLLGAANQALKAIGLAGVEQVSELLAADHAFLCTLPALDHYRDRVNGDYCGPLLTGQTLSTQAWPPGDSDCALVYLKGGWPGLNALLSALGELPVRALVHIDGERPGSYLAPANVRVSQTPLDIPQLLGKSDLIIHHGGHTLACQALLAGVPQWCLPLHLEQEITARRLNLAGGGHFYLGTSSPARLRKVLSRVLSDQALASSTKQLASRCSGWRIDEQIGRIVRRCQKLSAD